VDHDIHTPQRGCERVHFEQITLGELETRVADVEGALPIAHETTDSIATLGESLAESASDLSGRSGDEDSHAQNLGAGARSGLEKPDQGASKACRSPRAHS
jgi:hypothetical protein